MDDKLARQMTRQLKMMNFWITFFGSVIVLMMLIFAFFAYKTVVFVRQTQETMTQLQTKTQNALNVKEDMCQSALLSGTAFCSSKQE